MTPDEIRATIEGLERIARARPPSYSVIADDALTLLRWLTAANEQQQDAAAEVFADLDSERKAVPDAR